MKKLYFFLGFAILCLSGLIVFLLTKPQTDVLSVTTDFVKPPAFSDKNKFPIDTENIIAIGDIMLGRSVMETSLSKKDPAYPFEKVADKLREADLVFGNLETPIVQDCPSQSGGMKFCASPEMLKGLTYSGIDIVNLANNHTLNYGPDGLNQTKKYLSQAKIDYVGDGSLLIKRFGNVSFGFLGFDFVDKLPTDADLALIANSKNQVDNLLVMVHWGTEYTGLSNQIQKSEANEIINSGADVLIGGHPHWIQNNDFINGKPVFYSLGNFIFDQPFSEETKKGMTINLNYSGTVLEQISQTPIYMSNFAQPEWR